MAVDAGGRPLADAILWMDSRGAACLAAAALGHLTFDDIPGLVPVANTSEPNPAHRQIYDEMFAEFLIR